MSSKSSSSSSSSSSSVSSSWSSSLSLSRSSSLSLSLSQAIFSRSCASMAISSNVVCSPYGSEKACNAGMVTSSVSDIIAFSIQSAKIASCSLTGFPFVPLSRIWSASLNDKNSSSSGMATSSACSSVLSTSSDMLEDSTLPSDTDACI